MEAPQTIAIEAINEDRKYWLFRTEGGLYYPDFRLHNYIAFGCDEFNDLEELKNIKSDQSVEILKDKFKEIYPDEKRHGLSVKQLLIFINTMKVGDIVLIPSKYSKEIAIGEITSEPYICEESPTEESGLFSEEEDDGPGYELCPYMKRRNVKWLSVVKRQELDSQLFRLLLSHNAIADASPYEMYIDRILHDIYFKHGKINLVLRVKQTDNIQTLTLLNLLSNSVGLINSYEFKGKEEELQNFDIKLSVESPGKIQFIGGATAMAILLGGLATFTCGGDVDFTVLGQKYSMHTGGVIEFIKEQNRHEEELEKIRAQHNENLKNSFRELKIDPPKELR